MGTSGTDRQRALREKRQTEELKRFTVWLNQEDAGLLRAQYLGPRGGIDWELIVQTALAVAKVMRGVDEAMREPGEISLATAKVESDNVEVEQLRRKIRRPTK